MKYIGLFIIAIIMCCVVCACENIPAKKGRPSLQFTGMGYDKLNLFVYEVDVKNASGGLLRRDTLGIFCSDRKEMLILGATDTTIQNHMEWRSLTTANGAYKLKDLEGWGGTNTQTNDSFLFLHPMRDDYCRNLECCAYPYFKKKDSIGDVWDCGLPVGSQWASANYPIKQEDTFWTHYVLQDTATIITMFGKQFCYHVAATTSSVYGKSFTSYYLNNDLGIVCYTIKDIDNKEFSLKLISKTGNMDSIQFNNSFAQAYRRQMFGNMPIWRFPDGRGSFL